MKTTTIIKIALLVALLSAVTFSIFRIQNLKNENLRLKNNQEVLLSEKNAIMAESRKYKVSDSLNAYKVTELRLTLNEYKKYRSEDLVLIKKLKVDKSNMQKVIESQTETIYSLTTQLKDTVVVIDTVEKPLKSFEYKSKWIDVLGKIDLQTNTVALDITNREELTVVESVKYKRFLGFLWKTRRIKRRDVDVVSKNPNTQIIDVDYIAIEK